MARRRKTGRRPHRGIRATWAARPWLVRLCVGIFGFAVILYVIGPLLGDAPQPHAGVAGESFHADVLLPLAWLWLLVWVGAALASAARDRHGRRGHVQGRSRRRRSRRRRKQSAHASRPVNAAPGQRAGPSPAAEIRPPGPPVAPPPSPAAVTRENIVALSSAQFEQLVADSFRRKGFEVEFMPEHSRQGIDIVLRDGDKLLRVQCRHDRDAQVDVDAAHELADLVQAQFGGKAILATSGRLSPAAHAFCRDHAIHALDIDRLLLFADPAAMPALSTPVPKPGEAPEHAGSQAAPAV